MTEQQQHLSNLLQQRDGLERQMNQARELYWKVQGAIEYLGQIGVTLPSKQENLQVETEEEA